MTHLQPKTSPMFTATGAGFHITFDNGWTISVQWGPGNRAGPVRNAEDLIGMESTTADIFAWNINDTWWNFATHKPVKAGEYEKAGIRPDELIGYMQEVSRIHWENFPPLKEDE